MQKPSSGGALVDVRTMLMPTPEKSPGLELPSYTPQRDVFDTVTTDLASEAGHAQGEHEAARRDDQGGYLVPAARLEPGVERRHDRASPLRRDQIAHERDLPQRERHDVEW